MPPIVYLPDSGAQMAMILLFSTFGELVAASTTKERSGIEEELRNRNTVFSTYESASSYVSLCVEDVIVVQSRGPG
jgi:hypothetical protein